jgi:uncharacterized phage infection (PIP) family protein YhgE
MSSNIQDLGTSLDTIQKKNAQLSQDLQKIGEQQKKLVEALKRGLSAGSIARNEIEQLSKQAEQVASSITETQQTANELANPAHPDHGLPSGGARPDQGLPSGGAHPDQGLPGQGHVSGQPVPGQPNRPDQGLPPTGQPKK